MMIQRTIATLILTFLALSLVGATASGVGDYAIVDDNPAPVRGTYPTVQAAIESGAEWIEVRSGEYDGFTLNRPNVTIVMQGARFHNTTVTVWIETAAEGSVIQGDWEIYGDNTGVALGDFYNGTGVHNAAAYVTLEGLKCTNLLSFCVLNPVATAHDVKIRDCTVKNVATAPAPQLLAGTAIMFINGSSFNEVTGCDISGQSGGIHTWYGASHNRIHHNDLINNYGWIGVNQPRSAIEDYGEPGAENTGNWFYYNTVDGSNASAFELADRLWDVRVFNNEVRNVQAGFWMGGSTGDYSRGAVIENNDFYGHAGVISNWFSGTGTIKDNRFYNWDETATTGVIHVPSDGLGDVLIEGNTFDGGQSPLRYSAIVGTLRFKDNTIDGANGGGIGLVYLADTTNPNALIEGNTFRGIGNNRAVNQNSNTRVTVKGNVIYGSIWVGANSLIADNDFYTPYDVWTPVYVNSGMIVHDNRIYADNTPVVVDGSATGAMVIDNFVAKQDGTAAALPTCTGTNVCRDNWTP